MADLHVTRDRFEIRFTGLERMLAFQRARSVSVRRADIRSVAITDDPWTWIRGIRAPGTFLPLSLAAGTWKFHGGRDFLLVKGKQRSAVVVDLEEADWARLIVSTPRAVELVEALRVDPAPGETIDEIIRG